ncbi:MAG: hypothetical protein R3E36_06050 [Nitrosomonas sp.]|nr:hypothetical protein [Burkholderiales bacterium]MDR4520150.1 hypothetical protein [Nitrosomonas sp.]HQU62251.1 hypothetical protein [Nitrosomonas sp.]
MDKDKSFEQNNHSASAQKMCQQSSAKKQKRRMLLKGGAALPVVMTLYSGAALARTSNITGEAASITEAVFVNMGNGPQLLCVLPKEKLDNGAYDLGDTPGYTLITNPPIDPLIDDPATVLAKKNDQLAECHMLGGIMISGAAFTSIAAKTSAFDNLMIL